MKRSLQKEFWKPIILNFDNWKLENEFLKLIVPKLFPQHARLPGGLRGRLAFSERSSFERFPREGATLHLVWNICPRQSPFRQFSALTFPWEPECSSRPLRFILPCSHAIYHSPTSATSLIIKIPWQRCAEEPPSCHIMNFLYYLTRGAGKLYIKACDWKQWEDAGPD